jgi:stage II sporulation SpoE-like protein
VPDPEAIKMTILENPGIVEEGLVVLDTQLRAGSGGLIDLLAVDGSGALSILEIDRSGEEDLLNRSLEHQGWVGSQLHFLRRLYGEERIHPLRTPRAILLAENFSPAFLRKVPDLRIPITPLLVRLESGPGSPFLHLSPVPALPPVDETPLGNGRRPKDLAFWADRLTPEALAAGIERSLKPRTCPPVKGYDIAGTTLSCRSVGGDIYDFIPRSGNRLWVVVGDVAGKGHPAALILSHFQAMLRALAGADRPLPRLVGWLNDNLSRSLAANQFISFAVVELEPVEGKARFLNAGHNPPLLLRTDGTIERLRGTGPVLGVVPAFNYPTHEISIEPGDSLLLYTDGATESRNLEQEEFGEERLIDCLMRTTSAESGAGLASLERSILGFCGSAPRHDDITLLLLRRLVHPERSSHERSPKPPGPVSGDLSRLLP